MKHMLKRFLSVILCAVLVLGCIPAASAAFKVDNWAREDVEEMSMLGFIPESLMNSDMTQNITRAEMCHMAVLVYADLSMDFPLNKMDYYEDALDDTDDPIILFAYSRSIISGSNGNFYPNNQITRQDFFKLIHNMLTYAMMWNPGDLTMKDLADFSDNGLISGYAQEPIQFLYSLGVIKGSGGTLNPKGTISRQEAAVLLLRVYNYINEWALEQELQKKPGNYVGINSQTWSYAEVYKMDQMNMFPQRLRDRNLATPITRAEMCSIALLAYNNYKGKPYQPRENNPFTDTDDTDVISCYELGIVSGSGNGKFNPDDVLTREQFFTLAANFMTVLGYEEDTSEVDLSALFTDHESISRWAKESIALLSSAELVNGSDGKINPQGTTNCDQALVLFLRCYTFMEESSILDDLVEFALQFEGYRYIYGGTTPSGFDCSGFVMYVYKQFGYNITRTATSQYRKYKAQGTFYYKLGVEALQPGDLVFFYYNSSNDQCGHVGLYIGDGKVLHAANSNEGVVIDSLVTGYLSRYYYGAARVV